MGYPQGANALFIGAWDAAGVTVNYTKSVYFDNQQPTVALTGPTDAASTAGTQYVTATASAGPSGVHGISCSVDGGPAQFAPGATRQIPVSGVGLHTVRCSAQNNALDSQGSRAMSAPQAFALKIGVPTVTAIGFTRLVDRMRCGRTRERVTVPSRWVTVVFDHHRIRVRTKPRTRVLTVVKCHPRVVIRERTVWVTVQRGGRTIRVRRRERVRIVLLPHVDSRAARLVGHGRPATISGWLGTSNGVALGGQPVQILTAPDNGLDQFTPLTTTSTAADGSWSAVLPPGPSRLVEASYGGGAGVEASVSTVAREVVPADIRLLAVKPTQVAWGGTVRLVGRLAGGYLPSGGALVRLRIGLGSSYTTYGVHEHVGGRGRFVTSYTFGLGDPAVVRDYWFQASSLPMGDYPYAPANSGRVYVTVGGHPSHGRRRPQRAR